MNYFIKRGEQQYGPYTLAALQQYVTQGNISRDDLARSEAMTDWVPVSSILGNVTVTAPSAFGAPAMGVGIDQPKPPGLHWAIVLVLSIVTIGIFWIIWLFVEAAWIRKVRPQSRALFYLIGYLACALCAGAFGAALDKNSGVDIIFRIGGFVLYLFAIFGMRNDIEEYFSGINPVGLSLSGVMTFFFNCVYFQYHFREIREAMETGSLAPSTIV